MGRAGVGRGGSVPDQVGAEAVNKWLFNEDTVDKVLAHVMTRGLTVAGGDRLGKTILFAKNQDHANFIAERFNVNYPHHKGDFAPVITFKTEYAQDLMVGRGTRLCRDLFGPDQPKQFFYLFDYCQNLEYFSQNPETTDGSVGASLSKRLFVTRLELVDAIDQKLGAAATLEVREDSPGYGDPSTDAQLQRSIVGVLHREVGAMNLDNFLVRPKRRLVEKYSRAEPWAALSKDGIRDLASQVAGLPTELPSEDEEAKRFDLLLLRLQLAVLHAEPAFERLRDQVKSLAGLLEEKATIPMVRPKWPLERMFAESGVAGEAELQRAKHEAAGLGLFVRSLIGLDREAAKAAMAGFMTGKTPNASQIEFVNLVIDHLTEQGILDAARLYESPFTDLSPHGPDGLFTTQEIDALFATLDEVRAAATAA